MKFRGEYIGNLYTDDDRMIISFKVDEMPEEELEKLKNKLLDIEASDIRKKRSLNANAYFWELVSKISNKLGVDKDTTYIRQLNRYGVFENLFIKAEALERFRQSFRWVEVLSEKDGMLEILAYFGSSTYDTYEMSCLINGTVNDCHDLGIETMADDELERLVSLWTG